MRIVLITGGNTGLGHETARRLLALGYRVYIGCRSRERGEAAAKELGAQLLQMDVTDEQSVTAAAEELREREGRLDILVNNAGVSGGLVQAADVTAESAERVFATNVFGVVRVIHAFLPLLEKSENPVIVNVSSGLGSFGMVHDASKMESKVNAIAYCASKSAVSMLTVQYAKALPGMKVNAADPGATKTGPQFPYGAQTVTEGTDAIVRLATLGPDGPSGVFMNRDGVIPW